jgi:hypothetical protein
MADFNAQQGYIGFRGQVNKGGFLAPTIFTKVLSGGLGADTELLVPDPEIGGGRDITDVFPGAVKFSGDTEFYFRPESLGVLLYGLMGTVATSNLGSGAYRHTFQTLTSGNLPYLSGQEKVADVLDTFNYVDGKVNSLTLDSESNSLLRGSFNLIFTTQSGNISPQVPVFDTSPILVSHGGTITLDGTIVSCKSVSFEFNNNLDDDDFRIGNRFLGQLVEKRRELNVSLTIRPQDIDFYRKAVYGDSASPYTPKNDVYTGSLVLNFESPGNIPGGSGLPYRLQITLQEVAFKPFPISPSGDDPIDFEMEVMPLYDGSNPIAKAELWNGKSSVLI